MCDIDVSWQQGQWTRMCMYEQWRLHCTSQWRWEIPLSEHVYCVDVAFKMTEQVEQRICVQFCIELEHSTAETIWLIQKATAMGTWWLVASSRQHACSRITSHAEFLAKLQITQVTQPLYTPDLAPYDFWLFSKLKSPLKGRRFQIVNEIQENTTRQLMAIGRAVWGPKVPALKGTEVSLSYMYNVSCILYLL